MIPAPNRLRPTLIVLEPDTPLTLQVNGPDEVGQVVMLDDERALFPGSLWNKPTFYRGMSASLYGRALQIVRYVAEVQKPDGKRLPGYHDAQLDSLRFRMFSPAPVYPPPPCRAS